MNYVLQVVRGRSASTTLKLADGVTRLGRHDDCLIRIKSSQVSRRHCEVFEVGGKLTVRDLGSSNGTYVNGERVTGQQTLKAGDELTIGGVTLRVVSLNQPAAPRSGTGSKPGDTAVVDAVPLDDEKDEDEFEVAFDAQTDIDVIPLEETDQPGPPSKAKADKATAARKAPAEEAPQRPAAKSKGEDDAVAQFLLDLDLEDQE
jgi:pSer/pThr/pTyr-binding forkhead associated (FHA) protein